MARAFEGEIKQLVLAQFIVENDSHYRGSPCPWPFNAGFSLGTTDILGQVILYDGAGLCSSGCQPPQGCRHRTVLQVLPPDSKLQNCMAVKNNSSYSAHRSAVWGQESSFQLGWISSWGLELPEGLLPR